MLEMLQELLMFLTECAILLFEYTGVIVIIIALINGVLHYIKRSPRTRLELAKGLAMGLEFKLGSEILRTVVVRDLQEIFIVASIIALRALLTLLIHWEIKNEEKHDVEEKS